MRHSSIHCSINFGKRLLLTQSTLKLPLSSVEDLKWNSVKSFWNNKKLAAFAFIENSGKFHDLFFMIFFRIFQHFNFKKKNEERKGQMDNGQQIVKKAKRKTKIIYFTIRLESLL